MTPTLKRYFNKLARLNRRLVYDYKRRKGDQIFVATTATSWALYWVGYYITSNIQQKNVHLLTHTPGQHKHDVLHYVDRHAFLYANHQNLTDNNRVIVTWYHGRYGQHGRGMDDMFDKLVAVEPHLSQIVTSCHLSKRSLLEVGIPEDKISIIPIGVDLSLFRPRTADERQAARQKFGVPADTICIGSFQKDGNGWDEGLEPKLVKGPDIFIEAIAQLAKTHKNLMVFLTSPARGYVKQGLDKIGVPYVHHIMDDYAAIAECYAALDLYIITSRDEGGPKALMESWARGVPVVSTRVGQPADYMQHRQNGMLADIEDIAGLAESAAEMLADDALRQRCIENGLRDVEQLDWKPISASYLALYNQYIG